MKNQKKKLKKKRAKERKRVERLQSVNGDRPSQEGAEATTVEDEEKDEGLEDVEVE